MEQTIAPILCNRQMTRVKSNQITKTALVTATAFDRKWSNTSRMNRLPAAPEERRQICIFKHVIYCRYNIIVVASILITSIGNLYLSVSIFCTFTYRAISTFRMLFNCGEILYKFIWNFYAYVHKLMTARRFQSICISAHSSRLSWDLV